MLGCASSEFSLSTRGKIGTHNSSSEVSPGAALFGVEQDPVARNCQLAGPVEVDGLRQQDAGASEGHIARVVVKPEGKPDAPNSDAQPAVCGLYRCVVQKSEIQLRLALGRLARPARQALDRELQVRPGYPGRVDADFRESRDSRRACFRPKRLLLFEVKK